MTTGKKSIWITWESQPRNRSMSQEVGAKLYELHHGGNRLVRYLVLSGKTIDLIIRSSVKCVYVQNPSIILSSIAIVVAKLCRKPVIVDAHNAGVFPLEGRSRWLNRWCQSLFRGADITIVSNEYLADYVRSHGGRPAVVPDPPLHIAAPTTLPFNQVAANAAGNNAAGKKGKWTLLFICTWAADEPYMNVIEAARKLPKDILIAITGKYQNKLTPNQIESLPENVKLLGFLPGDDYHDQLWSADAIMDLTTRDHCLVCGAYETVAVEKPGIISDLAVNRAYFNKGFVYCDNTVDGIVDAVERAKKDDRRLQTEIAQLKKEHGVSWRDYLQKLLQAVDARY